MKLTRPFNQLTFLQLIGVFLFCIDSGLNRKTVQSSTSVDSIGVRLLILGDSNDRYIVEEWCQGHGHGRKQTNEFSEAIGCYDNSRKNAVFMIGFTAFKLLAFSFDKPNCSHSVDKALNTYFASIAQAAAKLLGGPPNALLLQSLFHDLEYTYWLSPMMVHGMAASDELWFEWISQWLIVVEASIRAANLNFFEPRWVGWRNSNFVLQGDHDGWLLLASRIPSANAEASRMAHKMEIQLVNFEGFSRLDDLADYVHPKRSIHRKFILDLMKNLTL